MRGIDMVNDAINKKVNFRTSAFGMFTVVIGMGLLACAPRGYVVHTRPATATPVPSTTVYFYPVRGQSREQQDRDRYECYLWAVKQTGFDPGQTQLAPHQRVEVRPEAPPGSDMAAGAVGGAIVGSMMSSHHDSGFGLVFGALTGAMLGAASDQERERQAAQVQRHYDAKEAQRYSRTERQARDYQRHYGVPGRAWIFSTVRMVQLGANYH
jgi:hypothetical protein